MMLEMRRHIQGNVPFFSSEGYNPGTWNIRIKKKNTTVNKWGIRDFKERIEVFRTKSRRSKHEAC